MLEQLLPFINKPSRYLGNEINSVRKDLGKVDLTFALAFPDLYEVGMSHLGLQILYSILNHREDIAAERVYAPWIDMEELMRKKDIPLCSLESSTPLNKFDVVGFSLQYEMSFTNVLTMLELSKIPLFSRERNEKSPLVVAGGGLAFNPEPVADFFDAIVVGDGEEVILEISDCLIDWKKRNGSRENLLSDLSEIEGVYIPSFFKFVYDDDGIILDRIPIKKGYTGVKKRVVADLSQVELPAFPLVPYQQIIHNRLSIEIARGCTRGCRFCQAGMIYRPYRERTSDDILRIAGQSISETGFEDISLLSLSAGDYSCIEELITRLMNIYDKKRVAVSLPSLRPGTLTPSLMEEIKRVRKTGFTLAPEAGSERLRRVINKNIDEDGLLAIAKNAFNMGWKLLKLYFMIGLPTEEKKDIEGIANLVSRVLAVGKGNRINLNVSIGTFIPKPHTPFQWEPQISSQETIERQDLLFKSLKGKKVKIKKQDIHLSFLEGVFSRGDRRLCETVLHAYSLGCRFDGWREHFRYDLWLEAFKKSSLNADFYLWRERSFSEILPWDHIDCGVDKDFLIQECQKGKQEILTPDCRYSSCIKCGVCDHKIVRNVIHARKPGSDIIPIKRGGRMSINNRFGRKPTRRFRVQLSKQGTLRFIGHLELISVLTRAVRRGRIPVKYSQGFHPLPKLSFGPALSLGLESLVEYFDIYIEGFMESDEMLRILNVELPPDIRIVQIDEISLNSQSLSIMIDKSDYLISFKDNELISPLKIRGFNNLVDDFMMKEELTIPREGEDAAGHLKFRKNVESLSSDDGLNWKLVLRGDGGPVRLVRGVFQLDEEELKSLKIIKTGAHFNETFHKDRMIFFGKTAR